MRNHPILSALLLTGCTSIAVGPSVVESRDLGYETPYWSVRAEGEAKHGKLVGIGQAVYADSAKLETEDGHGYRARALGGVQIHPQVALLGGVTYSRQETSAWTKEGYAPTLWAELKDHDLLLRLGIERLDDSDDKQWVYGLEARWRWVFGRYEYVDYQTLFAEGDGRRYELGLLFPLWKRR